MEAPRFIIGQFYTHFQRNLKTYNRTKTILRDRVPFYQEKEAIFEVILSTCSEFSQIGTPHFGLEGAFDAYLLHNIRDTTTILACTETMVLA